MRRSLRALILLTPLAAPPAGAAPTLAGCPLLPADNTDPGPYPIPPGAPVEGGPQADGDRHVLLLQQGSCKRY